MCPPDDRADFGQELVHESEDLDGRQALAECGEGANIGDQHRHVSCHLVAEFDILEVGAIEDVEEGLRYEPSEGPRHLLGFAVQVDVVDHRRQEARDSLIIVHVPGVERREEGLDLPVAPDHQGGATARIGDCNREEAGQLQVGPQPVQDLLPVRVVGDQPSRPFERIGPVDRGGVETRAVGLRITDSGDRAECAVLPLFDDDGAIDHHGRQNEPKRLLIDLVARTADVQSPCEDWRGCGNLLLSDGDAD